MERLFDSGEEERGEGVVPAADAPLAVRMRPRTLDELVGQEELMRVDSPLRIAIESGRPHSAVLYGPPGTGKTTLARIIAEAARGAFEEESAVNAGRAEVRAVIERARERRRASNRPTIFFLDEIHRFNKAQQDALLPAVEEGLLTLIGATTENPYFEVNSALLSRSQIYELKALGPPEIEAIVRRALADPERGIADPPEVADEAIELLATRSGGDARVALGALERAVEAARSAGGGVDLATAEDALQRKAVRFDKGGDQHYDYISAWIKATRGSDPDASLYYLAAMLEGGEDPRFIARRMVILASEDVGQRRPDGAGRRERRGPGRRPRGAARVPAQPRAGGRVPRAGAEVERVLHGPARGRRKHPRAGREAAAGLPARRALPGCRGARPRRGLRVLTRRARGRRRPAAAAGGGSGRALLPAHRPRLGGRALPPARGDPQGARSSG